MIDVIVILLLIAVIAFFVVRGVSVYRAAQVLEVENKDQNRNARMMPEDFTPNLRVTLICRSVKSTDADRICRAQYLRLYHNFFLLDAYVSSIVQQPCILRTVSSSGKELLVESEDLVDLCFTVDAQVDLSNPDSVIDGNFNPLIGSQELRIGKQYTLKTMELELSTTVTDMEILYAGG